MDKIKVSIGSVVTGNSGQTNDTRRVVLFEGERLAEYTKHDPGPARRTFGTRGVRISTRGVTQTLYRTADDRLVVHEDDSSHWEGEPKTETLHEVTIEDLGPTGRFADLGKQAGMNRPLTLDEALQAQEGGDDEAGPYTDEECLTFADLEREFLNYAEIADTRSGMTLETSAVTWEGVVRPLGWLLDQMAGDQNIMPGEFCTALGIERGSTYDDGARRIRKIYSQ
jgi:hypothetical protein